MSGVRVPSAAPKKLYNQPMETSTPPEPISSRPVIHFESGMHPLGFQAQNQVVQRFKDTGDLDTHIWNREVGKRIASYAYNDGLVLAVDGVGPDPIDRSLATTDDHETATRNWVKLPARPLELTKSGTLYLVGADFSPALGSYNHDEGEKELGEYARSLVGENALIAATLLGIMGARQGKFNRRDFLKAAGAGVVLTAIRPAPLVLAPASQSEEEQTAWQNLSNLLSPKLTSSVWTNGRTALLGAKMQDVAQSGLVPGSDEKTQYAVVMGSGHQDRYGDFQQKQARDRAINSFAREIVEAGREIYAAANNISVDLVPDDHINSLLDYLAKVDIIEVRDPREYANKDFYKSGLVSACFTEVTSFQSPQVESAIADLRPKAKTTTDKAPRSE